MAFFQGKEINIIGGVQNGSYTKYGMCDWNSTAKLRTVLDIINKKGRVVKLPNNIFHLEGKVRRSVEKINESMRRKGTKSIAI